MAVSVTSSSHPLAPYGWDARWAEDFAPFAARAWCPAGWCASTAGAVDLGAVRRRWQVVSP